jgi:hypothetical protein
MILSMFGDSAHLSAEADPAANNPFGWRPGQMTRWQKLQDNGQTGGHYGIGVGFGEGSYDGQDSASK